MNNETRKRVLFVCCEYWTGGAMTFLRRACQHLPEYGWECKLLLTGTNIRAHFDWLAWPSPLERLSPSYSWHGLEKRVARAVCRFAPAVLVGQGVSSIPHIMRYLYRNGLSNARFVDILFSDQEWHYAHLREHADVIAIVAGVSAPCVKRLQEIPELAPKARRMWYPVPCPAHPPMERDPSLPIHLVFLGNLRHEDKRVLDFIPLTAELLRRELDFRLTFIGDGTESLKLRQGLDALPGIKGKVQFLGWHANEEALMMLKQEDIILLLSQAEGQPIAILEAMSLGVVPVASDLPGLRELVRKGETGFLAEVGNPAQFADRITELAIDRRRLRCMSIAGWESVRDTFSMGTGMKKFAQLLEEAAAIAPPLRHDLKSIAYPINRMTKWGVPHFVQGIKRWALRQDLH